MKARTYYNTDGARAPVTPRNQRIKVSTDTPLEIRNVASTQARKTDLDWINPKLAFDMTHSYIATASLRAFAVSLLGSATTSVMEKSLGVFVTTAAVRDKFKAFQTAVGIDEPTMSRAWAELVIILIKYHSDGTRNAPDFRYVELGEKVLTGSTARAKRKPDGGLMQARAMVAGAATKTMKRNAEKAAAIEKSELVAPRRSIRIAATTTSAASSSTAVSSAPTTPPKTRKPGVMSEYNYQPIRGDWWFEHAEALGEADSVPDEIPWHQLAVAFELKTKPPAPHHIASSKPDDLAEVEFTTDGASSRKRRPTQQGSSSRGRKVQVLEGDSQLASYLLEMRSCLGHKRHSFGCLVRGTTFQIWYSDAIGQIRSDIVDMKKPERLAEVAVVLSALARSSTTTLGFDPAFRPTRNADMSANIDLPASLNGWWYNVPGKPPIEIVDTLYCQWSLVGRCTSVFKVKHDGKEAALKISYPFATRPREYTLIMKARDILRQDPDRAENCNEPLGVPEIYDEASGDLVSSGFRAGIDSTPMLDEDGEVPEISRVDRRLEVIVMELLEPLHKLPTPRYLDPHLGIVKTLFKLSQKGLLHRDVSSGNVMYRVVNGKHQGVLADFDLAIDLNDPRPQDSRKLHRTGNLPFLAIHVLEDSKNPKPTVDHIFRFDLESAFYVFLHDTLIYTLGSDKGINRAGEIVMNRILEADLRTIVALRTDLVYCGRLAEPNSEYQGKSIYLDAVIDCLAVVADSLRDGLFSVRSSTRDTEDPKWLTLDDHFTYEKYDAALNNPKTRMLLENAEKKHIAGEKSLESPKFDDASG